MNILSAALHVTGQTVAGVTVGGITDGIFWDPPASNKPHSNSQMARVGMECVAQLLVNGLVSAAFMKIAEKLNMQGMGDVTGGTAFIIALAQAQPHLLEKLTLLGRSVSSLVSRSEHALFNSTSHGIVPPSSASQQRSAIKQL